MNFSDISLRLIDFKKPVTIFKAKKVITMDINNPEAESIAVQQGIIVGVGSFTNMKKTLEAYNIEVKTYTEFASNAIYPGFSEHHMHPQAMGACFLNSHYVGAVPRKNHLGEVLPSCATVEALKSRLHDLLEQEKSRLSSSPFEWLNCWGFDPLHLDGADLTRDVLDTISSEFPICISHASGHVININSKGIEMAGYDELPDDPNCFRYEDGRLNGTIAEPPMMMHAMKVGAAKMDFTAKGLLKATNISTQIARINGCTSITDKGTNMPIIPGNVMFQAFLDADEQGKLATRVNLEPWFSNINAWEFNGESGWQAIEQFRATKNPRLSLGNLKLLTDGSVQGYTAHLLDPRGYASGDPNGHLLMSKNEIKEVIKIAESHGMSCSMHTNGNGATEAAILAIEEHQQGRGTQKVFRHQTEHTQLATENQFHRMAKLNMSPNLFANHMYYWGDVHAKFTVGEHEVKRMNATRSAVNHGLIFGLHSDDMVTEVNPLFTAWCAVNRKGMSGKIYGEDQCLTVDEALRAITYNHAYMAHQEDVRGSIEIGKWADFTVLEEEATQENAEHLKDIAIKGTVIGGDDIFLNQ